MPSGLEDIETVLPVAEASCHIAFHFEGSHYSDLKPISNPRAHSTRRPRKEEAFDMKQRRKMLLILEEPVASGWSRAVMKRPLETANPITRYFFGDDSPFARLETFDFNAFNQEAIQLINRLEKEVDLTILLLDNEYAQAGDAKRTKLVLEYALGFKLRSTDHASSDYKAAPKLKMDRAWKSRFEDENQADFIFYVIAKAHWERRLRQAEFLEKQLLASTTEIERMPVKLEL